jgi:hypothetical protein
MRKIALCGFAKQSIRQDWPEDVEIWTVNCAWKYGFTRITRLFEMHQVDQLTSYLETQTEWENQHWDWLQKQTDFPIYMLEHDPRIPNSIPYPIDEVCEDVFKHVWRGEDWMPVRYMTSSASYLMGLAIHELKHGDKIYLSGFEMATGSEYTYQRDGMTFMVGLAAGRGIDVILSPTSGIMRAKMYSYEGGQLVDRSTVEDHRHIYLKQKTACIAAHDLAAKADDMSSAATNYRNMFRADGAVQSITHLEGLSKGKFFGRQTLEAHLKNYEMQHSEAMGFFNKFNGQLEQAERNAKKLPSKINLKRLQEERERAEKSYRTMLLCEGAIQASQNLISVCDLQEPNLNIREVTRFVEDK